MWANLHRDRLRTSINVLGDAYGAAIVFHLSKDELDKMDEERAVQEQAELEQMMHHSSSGGINSRRVSRVSVQHLASVMRSSWGSIPQPSAPSGSGAAGNKYGEPASHHHQVIGPSYNKMFSRILFCQNGFWQLGLI